MTHVDRLAKYQRFLNEAIDIIGAGQSLKMRDLALKHGVDTKLIAFMRENGPIYSDSKSHRFPNWSTSKKSPFSLDEVSLIVSDFNKWMRTNRKDSQRELIPSTGGGLETYTTSQLIAELRSRGYRGTLSITKEVEV